MNDAAFSMKAFAAYLFSLGAILLTAPNVLLALFGFPETQEVWIRVVGLLVGVLAAFYWAAASKASDRCSVSRYSRAVSPSSS